MGLCTSETCKTLVLLFAIFLAGYLVLTNSREKVKEYFEEDAKDIPSKIRAVYKEVYHKDIPEDELEKLSKQLNPTNFDAIALRNTMTAERMNHTEDLVKHAFDDRLKRQPTPQEVDRYRKSLMSGELKDEHALKATLNNAPEKVITRRTRDHHASHALTEKDYELYRRIIATYQTILDRLPSSHELNNYFIMIKTNHKFTINRLEEALLASREHIILEKNQQNTVQGDLLGNITDRQIRMIVKGVYKSIYFREPDSSTSQFLKSKFIEFNLDEEKLVLFVKTLKSVEESHERAEKHRDDRILDRHPNSDSAQQDVYEKYLTQKPGLDHRLMEKPHVARPHSYNHTAYPKRPPHSPPVQQREPERKVGHEHHEPQEPERKVGHEHHKPLEPERKVGHEHHERRERSRSRSPYRRPEHMSKCPSERMRPDHDTEISTQEVLAQIKNAPKCPFDRNKIENDSKAFANLVHERNHDEKHCSKYLNAKDNLVLYPQFKWSVPQKRPPVCWTKRNEYRPLADQTALIGTLLKDARDTEVGSILPKFSFREHVHYCPDCKK
jgi:hypothetical protein